MATRARGLLILMALGLSLAVGVAPGFTQAPSPPPPVQVEKPPPSPGPQFVWIAGHWAWQGGRWAWVSGREHREAAQRDLRLQLAVRVARLFRIVTPLPQSDHASE